MVVSHGVEIGLSRMRKHKQVACKVWGRGWARGGGDRLQAARVLSTPLGWPVGFVLVPSWALLSLSPHPHAVLSLALAAGSLLPPPESWLRPPAQLEPPLLRGGLWRSVGALVLPRSLAWWAWGGGPGLRACRPQLSPLPPFADGEGE